MELGNSENNNNYNNNNNMGLIKIQNYQLAHMIAQIRVKQLSCLKSQNKMRDNIISNFKRNRLIQNSLESDCVKLTSTIQEKFKEFEKIGEVLKNYLLDQPVQLVGYPNQRNRTHQQLAMAVEWINGQDAYKLFEQLENGQYLNGLSNDINNFQLPILESDHKLYYWGNENPSVTSLVLYGINKVLGYQFKTNSDDDLECEDDYLVGCGKRVPFLKAEFQFPRDILDQIEGYPFANSKSMILFGSYQFGGQRRFDEQYLFGPEDCSSSVGKASKLSTDQVRHFSTQQMIEAYNNPNNVYRFKAITTLFKQVKEDDINKIQPGDIYLTTGHTGLFLTKPNYQNRNEALTIEFSRNLELETESKCEGGGIRKIMFDDKIKNSEYFVLRPTLDSGISHSILLKDLIQIIDSNYSTIYCSANNNNNNNNNNNYNNNNDNYNNTINDNSKITDSSINYKNSTSNKNNNKIITGDCVIFIQKLCAQ